MCADAYKNYQYCFFCKQIYLENGVNADADGKAWIECDKCKKWVSQIIFSSTCSIFLKFVYIIFSRDIWSVRRNTGRRISKSG